MAKYELLIAVADEADLASGHKRKKEGDILCAVASPHLWGRTEIHNYLIVPIEIDKTLQELNAMFNPDGTANAAGDKRDYRISLLDMKAKLPELDMAKVRDKGQNYQPFKREADFSNLPDSVDCGLSPTTEYSLGKNPSDVIYQKSESKLVDVTKVAVQI